MTAWAVQGRQIAMIVYARRSVVDVSTTGSLIGMNAGQARQTQGLCQFTVAAQEEVCHWQVQCSLQSVCFATERSRAPCAARRAPPGSASRRWRWLSQVLHCAVNTCVSGARTETYQVGAEVQTSATSGLRAMLVPCSGPEHAYVRLPIRPVLDTLPLCGRRVRISAARL